MPYAILVLETVETLFRVLVVEDKLLLPVQVLVLL
tara:strand:+ start:240 stop:344 length:105 start_codon:yes stop_codon:yes gene_type:complete